MRAGSSFTNFVTDGNVRQNAQDFNPNLYNNVGGVTGYPGPNNGVAAAAGNPGPEIVNNMKGGRPLIPGPNYQSFRNGDDWPTRGHAPFEICNGVTNKCGGKRRRGRKMSRGRKTRKTSRAVRKMIRTKSRRLRRASRKASRKVRKMIRKASRKARKMMRGGSPAPVPPGSESSGYNQYLSNQSFSNSYEAPLNIKPEENALANPVIIKPTNNCGSMR